MIAFYTLTIILGIARIVSLFFYIMTYYEIHLVFDSTPGILKICLGLI